MWDPIATVSWRFQIPHVAQAQYCFFWGTRNKGTAGEWELILIILLRNPQPCYDWTVLRALQQPQPYAGSGVQPQLPCGEWCANSAPMRGVVRNLRSHAGNWPTGRIFPTRFSFLGSKSSAARTQTAGFPKSETKGSGENVPSTTPQIFAHRSVWGVRETFTRGSPVSPSATYAGTTRCEEEHGHAPDTIL